MNLIFKFPDRFVNTQGLKARSGGFTLIELAIMISVIAILGAIAVPTAVNMVDRFSRSRAVDTITSELHAARMLAIRSARRATVSIDYGNPTQYTVQWGSPVQTRTVDMSTMRGGARFTQTPPGTDAVTPDPVNSIIFSPQGFTQVAPQGWGDIYLTDNVSSQVTRIEVSFSGAVNKMRWSETGNTWMYD